MNPTVMLVAGLIPLPAVGLAFWTWRALARAALEPSPRDPAQVSRPVSADFANALPSPAAAARLNRGR